MRRFTVERQKIRLVFDIDTDDMDALLASEDYRTDCKALQPGEQTLSDRLKELEFVLGSEYDGHFGEAVYIDVDKDTPSIRRAIAQVLDIHLTWCHEVLCAV